MSIRAFWLLAALLLPMAGWCTPTTLTYQGQLQQAGAEFTGTADLEFRLFDQETDGLQVGPTVSLNDWPVTDGVFQVELDFGSVYGADPRWLQVTVDGFDLIPRQAVRPAPVALYALAGNDWQLDGSNVYYSAGNVGIGTSTPAAALEVRSDSDIGTPQLRLTESHDDFARLTFANSVSDRFWTLAALTRGVDPGQDRFNLFHNTSGNVVVVDGEGNVGLGAPPTSIYRLNVRDGMHVSRDTGPGTLTHLAISETAGSEPVRQLFWNSAAARGWRIDSGLAAAGVTDDRLTIHNTGAGDVFTLSGSGAAGLGFTNPPAALAVQGTGAYTWTSGNGRGDFYIGDGSVGLSMGVALGGGGRGVSRIWTNGGVEHLFIGSAAYGPSLSVFPGQVGVNTTSPQATLDVDGGFRVRDLADPAVTGRRALHVLPDGQVAADEEIQLRNVHASAFRPKLGNALSVGFAAITYFTTGIDEVLTAPLMLPDGAEVTSVTAWLRDQSAVIDLSFRVRALDLGTNQHWNVAWGHSAGDTVAWGDVELTPSGSASDRLIDNETRTYFIDVYPVNNGDDAFGSRVTWQGSDAGLQAIVVRYRQL
ncbi:hypothetical protein G4Y73_12415 [Wenzhouxiangella sp. XN201]|uniref:hypothetical protein n=1 Tax=Wenzhouxiangella sp. XN201 TaxID=2710755 RepID=UPI0013CDB125|nr:hypothetical protein [Wenzhouxiangella sp. XN201]NEZ04953.1 hypothetical protein [Wenzhouxiangella sp. XN201]